MPFIWKLYNYILFAVHVQLYSHYNNKPAIWSHVSNVSAGTYMYNPYMSQALRKSPLGEKDIYEYFDT